MSRFFSYLTLVCVSAAALLLAVALHEHLGHSTACYLLGSKPFEMGALYVECDTERLSPNAFRLVALAGPIVSLLTGIFAFKLLLILAKGKPLFFYFLWLFATASLLEAFGYMIFSGISGLGDLGSTKNGMIYGFANEWAWRLGLVTVGIIFYRKTVIYAAKRIGPHLPANIETDDLSPRKRFVISYITSAVLLVGISLLNPVGSFVTLISGVGPSLGGQYGLLKVSRFIDKSVTGAATQTIIKLQPSLRWVAGSLSLIALYTILFGPTLYLS